MLTAGINSYEKKMGTMLRDGNSQCRTRQKRNSIIDPRAGFPVLYTSFHFPPLHGERSLRFIIPMHTSGRRFTVGFMTSGSTNGMNHLSYLSSDKTIDHTNEHRCGSGRSNLRLLTTAW